MGAGLLLAAIPGLQGCGGGSESNESRFTGIYNGSLTTVGGPQDGEVGSTYFNVGKTGNVVGMILRTPTLPLQDLTGTMDETGKVDIVFT
ncbi:MAG: hypothetical protein V4671_19415, partial [Armatimonadota bacterium]